MNIEETCLAGRVARYAALADPDGQTDTSPADLMRERAGIAADLEDAELQWLDAQENLEKVEG